MRCEIPDMTIRQLVAIDATPLFELIDRNRPHLSQFGDTTAEKYPTKDDVLQSIVDPVDLSRIRFGIWDGATLVGTINLTGAEVTGTIGYWIGSEFGGRGIATAATRAVCKYAFEKLGLLFVHANTHPDNLASQRVLIRSGFHKFNLRAHNGDFIFVACVAPSGFPAL